MRYLSLPEVLEIHRQLLAQSGGASGIRDLGAIDSALAQPLMTFGGEDLYATIEAKAAAICFSLIMNHPFVDGNKRVGHAAMETFLVLNGYELCAEVADAEAVILRLAAGRLPRADFVDWVTDHIRRCD
jgi:death on curing protein